MRLYVSTAASLEPELSLHTSAAALWSKQVERTQHLFKTCWRESISQILLLIFKSQRAPTRTYGACKTSWKTSCRDLQLAILTNPWSHQDFRSVLNLFVMLFQTKMRWLKARGDDGLNVQYEASATRGLKSKQKMFVKKLKLNSVCGCLWRNKMRFSSCSLNSSSQKKHQIQMHRYLD